MFLLWSVLTPDLADPCEEVWVKICFEDVDLFVCGLYVPHSTTDESQPNLP
jgi:hypothetical protein